MRLLDPSAQGISASESLYPQRTRETRPAGEASTLSSLAREASQAWEEARKALRNEDFEEYGRRIKNLEAILNEMNTLAGEQ
jgi:flagellin-specific chaperone FliS